MAKKLTIKAPRATTLGKALLATAGLAASACGPDPLIGSWQGTLSNGSTLRFDFNADGTMATTLTVRSTEGAAAGCVTTQRYTGGTWSRSGSRLQFTAMTSCSAERAMCTSAELNRAAMACTSNAFAEATANSFTLSGETLTLAGDPPTNLARQ